MEKIEWKTLRTKFAAGETLAEKEIALEKGKRIVAAVATSTAPGKLISLGLFENGNEVSAPMDLDFWKRSNSGHYLDGFKPIEYRGGSTVSARFAATTALAADIEIELVFGIIKEDTTC